MSEDEQVQDDELELEPKNAPADRAENGPLDDAEAPVRPYVDLGGIRVLPRQGLQLRLEVEEKSKRVVAVTLELGGSTLQVQPFAAPRSEGIWASVRERLTEQLEKQGAKVTVADGTLGPELHATLKGAQDGQRRNVRLIGVDGPRWLLQGLIGGPAATDDEALEPIVELFRSLVVVRGATPMPPRELIPLRAPAAS